MARGTRSLTRTSATPALNHLPGIKRATGARVPRQRRMFRKAFLAAAALALSACGGGDSSLTIDNQSSYSLFEIHVAQVDDPNWGPNLLGSEPLDPGEQLVITSIDCDTYDVDIIDD